MGVHLWLSDHEILQVIGLTWSKLCHISRAAFPVFQLPDNPPKILSFPYVDWKLRLGIKFTSTGAGGGDGCQSTFSLAVGKKKI